MPVNVSVIHILARVAAVMVLSAACPAMAETIEVKDAWIRGMVDGQSATGAFMEITSKVSMRLVSVSSPSIKVTQMHNMTMDGGVMKMFQVDGIDLPAGAPVKLAPGGYHVMLMNLPKPLIQGQHIPMRLTFELPNKQRRTLDIRVEVRDITGEPKKHKMH